MKTTGKILFGIAILGLITQVSPVQAQYDSGSTGADGPLDVATNTTIPLPPDGLFNYTTVNVQGGATLSFTANALNTPVKILASGDVTIDGTINPQI